MERLKEYSAGGAIFQKYLNSEPQVLLIRIRKAGFELPKGHIEAGERASEAALRDYREEVGIQSELKVGEKIGELTYRFRREDKEIEKTVSYFIITGHEVAHLTPNDESP